MKWAKVIDERLCIGCHACTIACKAEHQVPLGVTRTFVKQVEVGVFPSLRRHFQVTRCNQCDDPPCVHICPTGAMYQRPDGIVDFNRGTCIGCKACIAACPYDAIYIDPETHSAEKCNFCTHRIDAGLEPACVSVCPTQAIIVGDMTDPESKVSKLIGMEKTEVRRPEKGTKPKVFYVEGVSASLDPLGAATASTYETSAKQASAVPTLGNSVDFFDPGWQDKSRSGYPADSAAAAIVSYGNRQQAPWDWRVSAYSWTKAIGGGTYVMAALGAIFAGLGAGAFSWDIGAIVVSAVFTALTGGLLIGDLSHPERFYTIFYRGRWESWLVRGAALITAFSVLLAIAFFSRLLGATAIQTGLRWAGIVVGSVMVAYTAFLFGQAKGRDMWQDPLLPLQMLAQGALAGAGVLAILAAFVSLEPSCDAWLRWALVGAAATQLALVASSEVMPQATANARYAAHNMTRGRWAVFFWGGNVLVAVALAMAAAGVVVPLAGFFAVIGMLAYEHAYVQAGQSAPLT